MREIKDGLLFDTDKAELLHSWDNGYFRGDAHYVSKDLYRTEKGNYFIHIYGGALSEYGEHVGNQYHSDEFLITLLPDAVVLWLEKHGGTDAILEHFNDQVQEG